MRTISRFLQQTTLQVRLAILLNSKGSNFSTRYIYRIRIRRLYFWIKRDTYVLCYVYLASVFLSAHIIYLKSSALISITSVQVVLLTRRRVFSFFLFVCSSSDICSLCLISKVISYMHIHMYVCTYIDVMRQLSFIPIPCLSTT